MFELNNNLTFLSYIRYFFYVFLAHYCLFFCFAEIFVSGEGLSVTKYDYISFDYQYTVLAICSIVIVFLLVKSSLLPLSLPLAKYQKNNKESKKYKFGDYCFWSIVLLILMVVIKSLVEYIWDINNSNNHVFKQRFDYYFTPLSFMIIFYLPIILAVFRKLPFWIK